MSPARRRQMVDREHPSLSLVRQCALLGVSRSSLYYRPRAASEEALSLMGDIVGVLGDATIDVYLNDNVRWSNLPAAAWNYKLGGYQVLKKWLSYREKDVLGSNLSTEEVNHFSHTARRIAATLKLTESAGLTVA